MRKVTVLIRIAAVLSLVFADRAYADLIAPAVRRGDSKIAPVVAPVLEGRDEMLPGETGYFTSRTVRIRWARGLFGLVPERDGIGSWAPPIEIGASFVVGIGTVVKWIFADLPASITVHRPACQEPGAK